MALDKVQYVVALNAEFAEHYGITTVEAAKYLSQYKALELFDRQYGYLHTQSFASNVRDHSAYCRRMGGTLWIPEQSRYILKPHNMCDPKQQSKIEFVSFCIEQYKKANELSGAETEQMFLQRGVIDFLLEHYEVLPPRENKL